MTLKSALHQLTRNVSPRITVACGLAILFGMHAAANTLRAKTLRHFRDWQQLTLSREHAAASLSELQALRDLKARDIERLQAGVSKLTSSRRSLYEAGLELQEERRLLEKQWEIMTTYLLVDIPAGKIHIMRGEQALQSFSVSYASAAFANEGKPLPVVSQLVSKERFAHPERGESEETDGTLVWTPPQVGTSVRANALGEYVMFFRGDLILHGPPRKKEDHTAFPHWCVGLTLPTARSLYANSFIGAKIVFKRK